jgi:gliding motility-associated-like protein
MIQGSTTDTGISVRWNGSGSGSITLTQTNPFGCDSAVSRTITIRPTPAPVITGSATVCAFKTTTYTTNTSAGNTYQWNVAGGTILGSATDTIVSVRWNGSGSGTIILTQTNSFGCDSTVSRSITINPTPTPVISGPSPACAFKATTYTTNTTTGNTYQWNVTGGTILGSSTDTSITVKWNGSGTGSVTLLQTNVSGCDSSVGINIPIRPTPAPVITGPVTVCAFKTYAYNANTTAGNSYQWSMAGGAILGSSTDTIVIVRWNGSGTGTVTLNQTNSFGCDSTVNKIITILTTPFASVSGPLSVCAFRTSTYTTNATTGNTYLWNVTGGTIQGSTTDTILTVKWNTSGMGYVTLTQTNPTGCDSALSKAVTINPTPTPLITGPATVCAFKTYAYNTNTTSGNTYQWIVTGGVIQGSSTDTLVIVKWNGNGAGSVALTQTSSSGCDSVISKSVSILPTPAPVINGPSPVCAYKTVSYGTNVVAGNTYQWAAIGGTILGSSNDTVVSVRWNANATGTIQVTQTNPSGCDSTMNRTITIDPTPLTAIAGSSLVCAYKTTTYTTNTTSGNTYQWIVTGGTITGSSTDTMISVKWNGSGVGSVSLTQTSIPGCDSMVSRTITIRPTPASVITGPGTVCAFKTYTYGTNTAAGSAYQWSITGGTLLSNATDSSVSVRWNTNGTGSISLTQTNAAGCDSTVSRTITIQPSPYTTISGSPSLCANTISVYNTNTTTGNTYQWSVTGGTIQGSNTDTMITVSWGSAGAGSVTLKQQNMIGCDSSVTLPITINAKPVPVFIGPSSVCEFKQNVYSINKTAGSTYQWSVTGGTISGTTTDTIIHVQWNAKGAGTITLKEINAALCDSDITKNIIIRATPVPVMNGPVLVCEYKTTAYSTNTTAGNSYQWTVTGGTILGSATDTVIAVKWGPTGKGTIAVKQVNTFGCDSLVSETITIQPTPVPLITGPASVCAGQQAVYNSNIVSGITYNWSVTGGAVTGSNIDSAVTVRWNNAGPGVITLKQTNSFGCDSIITYAVVIHALPVPIISGNDTICAYKFSAHSTPVVPGHRYRWKATGGTISGSDTLSSTGIYWDDQLVARVTLTLINAAGCDSTVFKDIVVKKAPKPVITGDTMVCRFGQYRYKTDTITGATYKWTITAGAVFGSSVDTAVNVLWSNATTGKIQLLVTNSNGCDSLVSKQASIVDRVHSSISGPDTVCLRKLAVFSVPAVSGHSYLWSATGGTILSDTTKSTVTVMWTSTGNKTISLYERTAADCDTALLKKIFVKPTPVPVISGPATLCAYTKGIYTVRNAVSDTFKWVVTGGVIESMISDTQVVVKWGGSTAGNVQLKQINKEGCDSTAAFNVTIQHAPIPVINGKLNVCAYRTERYSSLYEPGATYNWNVSGGTLNKLHDTLVEVKWHQDGAAGITLQMISPSLCDSTVSKAVSIQATPDPDFSGPMMPCANSVAGYAVSAIPGHSYSWSVSGGTIQGSTTLAFVNVLWGAGGSGSLSLRQQSPLGCDSTIVKFIDIKTHPVPVIHGSAIACTGVSAYTYKATPTGAYAYHWTIQGGRILSGAGTSDIEVNWPLTGTHELTLQITDTITTCDSTVTLTILVDSVIKPEINATALAGCVPLKVVFSGNQALPGYTYHWDFGNGNFSSNVNPEYVYTQPGQFEIKVVVTTSTGCKDSAMTPAAVSYIPVADFEYEFQNDRIYANEDTVKFINRSQGGNLFLWQISSDSLDTIVNPETMYHSPGFYTVKLTTIDTTTGCEQSTTRKLEVRVRERLYTPNAFTPNGDGINDYFSVSVTNIVEFEVLIFDRWGAIMYRSNDPKFKWDGSFDNAPAQADVYGYTINAKGYHGKIFTQSGNVTLLR